MTKPPDPADRPWSDDPDVHPLDILDVTEDFMQDLVEKRRNAMDVQASAAIRAILAGESPYDIAHRCGFKDPGEPPEQLQQLDQALRRMMGHMDQPREIAVISLSRWLTHWLHHQITGAAEDCDGA